MKKVGYLKNAVAKSNGFYSPTGEKLKSQGLSDEFIAEWNGTAKPKKAAPAPKVEEVVEEVTEEVVEEAPKPVAKKKGKKKKGKVTLAGIAKAALGKN